MVVFWCWLPDHHMMFATFLYHDCVMVFATRSSYDVCYLLVDWWCELCGYELLWDVILLCQFGLVYSKLIRAYSPFGIHVHCNGCHWELQLRTGTGWWNPLGFVPDLSMRVGDNSIWGSTLCCPTTTPQGLKLRLSDSYTASDCVVLAVPRTTLNLQANRRTSKNK
jgi:hypothetical protein